MSVAKLHRIERSRKAPGACEKCHAPIGVGVPYVYYTKGFRSSHKHLRCDACPAPSMSERESNDKLAMIYAAQEHLHDAVSKAETIDDLKSACDDAAQEVRDAISEWEDAKSNLEQAFQGGCPAIEQIDEYLSNAESLADALDGVEFDEHDDDVDEDAATEEEKVAERARIAEEYLEDWRDAARSAFDDNSDF